LHGYCADSVRFECCRAAESYSALELITNGWDFRLNGAIGRRRGRRYRIMGMGHVTTKIAEGVCNNKVPDWAATKRLFYLPGILLAAAAALLAAEVAAELALWAADDAALLAAELALWAAEVAALFAALEAAEFALWAADDSALLAAFDAAALALCAAVVPRLAAEAPMPVIVEPVVGAFFFELIAVAFVGKALCEFAPNNAW
jgi:hypothetical protein